MRFNRKSTMTLLYEDKSASTECPTVKGMGREAEGRGRSREKGTRVRKGTGTHRNNEKSVPTIIVDIKSSVTDLSRGIGLVGCNASWVVLALFEIRPILLH